MANTSRVRGFRPVKNLSGAPWNGRVTRYAVAAADATVLGVGDLVKLDGTGDADGVPSVTRAAASARDCIGPIVSIERDVTNLNNQHRAASTAAYVYVSDDPDIIMEAEEDAVGGALAVTNIGQNVNFTVPGDASTITGYSQMGVDSSTAATTNSLPLTIIGFVQSPENEVGANAKVMVKWNTHFFSTATGATGV